MLVLVVDDEESLCELLAEVLAGDYEVIKAYNGKAALELARQKKPDIIISDVMMPHMSGVELLKALRAEPDTAHIPVILLSAAPLRAKVTEASAFLTKPFEIEVLENVVAKVAHEAVSEDSPQEAAESAPQQVIEAPRGTIMEMPRLRQIHSAYWKGANS